MNPSLLLIPDRYKAAKLYSQIPDSGAGDLTFARNSNATRVNSAGLIEKVRTNLFEYSNTFSNAFWGNIGSSETSGQAGYDGTNNAWSLTEDTSTGVHVLSTVPSTFGFVCISVYAKAGSRDWIYLRGVQSSSNVRAWFNLSTGTIGTVETNGLAKIESIGNGWYRCSLSLSNFESGFESYIGIASADNTSSYVGNGTGNILIQNSQYELGDIATPYIPTTTAAVSVGITANIPRLDYTGGGCPSLLLEPQRTNLITFSEQFNNAAWVQEQVTITANATASPDGFTNADKVIANATAGDKYVAQIFTVSIGSAFTTSAYFKSSEYTYAFIRFGGLVSNPYVIYNLATQSVVATTGLSSSSITAVGNGWYRITATITSTTTTLAPVLMVIPSTGYTLGADNIPEFTGDGTSGGFIWGAQLEAGSYVSSYIPTLGSSVTRLADVASKTGISSLLNSTEGTLYVEVERIGPSGDAFENVLFISDTSTNNFANIVFDTSTSLYRGQVRASGSTNGLVIATAVYTGTIKIAIAYAENDLVLYINGVQQGADSSVTIPAAAFNSLGLGGVFDGTYYDTFRGKYKTTAIYTTRLSNADLQSLTSL